MRKAGLYSIPGIKPTSLRDAFEDALADAETYHKTKETLMGHTSTIEHHYGSHNKMVSGLIEAMKKVYPLICLNEANLLAGQGNGMLSPEQLSKVLQLLEMYDKGFLVLKKDEPTG
jgi:hypothetical protein